MSKLNVTLTYAGRLAAHDAPERFHQIIKRVMDRDRLYFELHPKANSYHRVYVPGEAWPYSPPGAVQVCVYQVEPGVRRRLFLDKSGRVL